METVAGIAATGAGEWIRAENHYRKALDLADKLPDRIEQGEVRRWYAQMLLMRREPGDPEEAARLLEQACGFYRALGMTEHQAMTESLLHAGIAPISRARRDGEKSA